MIPGSASARERLRWATVRCLETMGKILYGLKAATLEFQSSQTEVSPCHSSE